MICKYTVIKPLLFGIRDAKREEDKLVMYIGIVTGMSGTLYGRMHSSWLSLRQASPTLRQMTCLARCGDICILGRMELCLVLFCLLLWVSEHPCLSSRHAHIAYFFTQAIIWVPRR